MKRDLVWEATDSVATEHLAVEFGDSVRADGVVVGVADDAGTAEPFRIRYRVRCDESTAVQRVVIDGLGTDGGLELEHDGAGNWREDGDRAPALAGCRDVDIAVTPFTNTIPIRRLELDSGESATISAVYLDVPTVTPEAVEQRYTCLEPLDSSGGRFRYESVDSEFTAELSVDSDGVVSDYPGLFRRAYP